MGPIACARFVDEGVAPDAVPAILSACANDIAFVERATDALPHCARALIDVDHAVVLLDAYHHTGERQRAI